MRGNQNDVISAEPQPLRALAERLLPRLCLKTWNYFCVDRNPGVDRRRLLPGDYSQWS